MEDCLKNLEYFSSIHHCLVIGDIIGIEDEDSYIMKNKKDGTEEICESKNIRRVKNISSTPLNEGTCEYIKDNDEFLEVKIKEQKGSFYILEIIDEEGNQTSLLSRQKQLRYIEYIPIEDYISEKYNNVILDIPEGLSLWVKSDRFKDVVKQLKGEDSGETESNELFVNWYPYEFPKYIRVLCHDDKKDIVKLLLNTAMESEKKLTSINKDKENSKKQLEEVQKKNQAFYIDKKFIGFIIGKEGANIKQLQNKYNVNIKIDSKKLKDKRTSKVIITGDDGNNVDECFKEINLVEKIYELPENSVNNIKKKVNQIVDEYNVKLFYISNEEKKDESGYTYKAPNVTIVGRSEKIEQLYNNEIKYHGNYNYGNNYNNYNYSSGSSYRQNKKYNNYYNNYNQNNYKYNKEYNSHKNYY